MKKIFTVMLLCVTMMMFVSCATIFTGSKKKVVFDGKIDQPVNLTIDGYKVNKVSLPYTHKIKGGFNETVVKAEADGYEPAMIMIDKSFNAISVINLLNILGWGIDAATGAMMKPEYKFYEFDFKEKPQKNVEIQD